MRLILLTILAFVASAPAVFAQHTSMDTSATCVPVPNSTGNTGLLTASGTYPSLTLTYSQLPTSEFGQALFGPTTCPDSSIIIGTGTLCACGNFATGMGICRSFVYNTGAAGAGTLVLPLPDPTNPSQPCASFVGIFIGETWTFQLWHRDGGTTNLTNGVAILFG